MNYYNEFDHFAADWLENLIAAELIPAGTVDRRSIKDVQPDDLRGYTQCHFFAGIGGWAEALRLAGWDGPCWTGSCPCQPFSAAGKRAGVDDERHLWPEFYRLISQCCPAIVFGEQVASKDGREWLAGVFADLESLGYAAAGADLCAAGIGAPHIRQRLWWVADAGCERLAPRPRRSRGAEVAGLHGNESDASSKSRRLANSNSLRSAEYVNDARERAQGDAADSANDSGPAQRLGNASSTRQSQREIEQDGWAVARVEGSAAIVAGSAWDGIGIVECRDNRARRVSSQSGDEPLAYGIPGNMGRGRTKRERLAIRAARTNRTGRLKGYGNAIVPAVAAEFITAFFEAN